MARLPLNAVATTDTPAAGRFGRVAVVHEWLTTYAGSERVLAEILRIWPEADLFCIVDFLPEADRRALGERRVTTSFIQRLPRARTAYRSYLPLMPIAVEQFDLSGYDLVISSSHAVAKGVITGPDQIHVSYVHSPVRYAWDLQHQYLAEAGLRSGVKSWLARAVLHYLRLWDQRTANGVDLFVANSAYVARRIHKVYGCPAKVVFPPVDVERFVPGMQRDDYYLSASRFVPYKRMALVVDAFAKMPDRRLIVIGDGPEFEKVKARATPNITLLGYQPNDVLVAYMQRAKAFVFAAEEDFGIAPVEAQACGTPVIAFGKGGALETVIDSPDPARRTGVFFRRQQTDDIVDAVRRFEANGRYDPAVCRQHALQFSAARFRQQFTELVELACGVAPERDSTIVPLQPRAAGAPKSGTADARAQSFDAAASWSDEERKSWI